MIQYSFFENIPGLILNQSINNNISQEEKVISQERKQSSLFGDNWIYKNLLEKFPDHPLIKLRPLVDKILKEIGDNIEVYYRKDFGRPSYPVSVIFKMLLLEYLYNLSDVAVSQAVCCNFLFRWFCGLDIVDNVPDDTTLVKFRKRLGEEGFQEIFKDFILEAKQLGYGKGKLRIIDATHVLSFSRGLGAVSLLKDGAKRIIKRITARAVVLKQSTKQKVFKLLERKQIAMREVKKVIKRLIKEIDHQVDETTQKIINQIQAVIKEGKKLGSLVDTAARWRYKKNKDNFPTHGARKGLTNIDIIRIKTTRFWL